MEILDGKAVAARLRGELALEIAAAVANGARPPGLAVILGGADPASAIYVRNKQRACEETGIVSVPFLFPADIPGEDIVSLIRQLNTRDDIDGILVQMPLPGAIDTQACIMAIAPDKDVDGFHPLNIGRLALGLPCFVPCTAAGVIYLLKSYGFTLAGKKAVVVGRSNIVGKPLALLLESVEINATVTVCHSATRDLKRECLGADYLFLALGKPHAITGDMVSEGCVVIDIGINRGKDGICGDADLESIAPKAAAITPVPGGVGPMTIAMLLANTVKAWRMRLNI